MSLETLITQLIVEAGEAKNLAFEALEAAKSGDFEQSKTLLKNASDVFVEAHKNHMALLKFDLTQQNDLPSPILLMHAEDHMMSAILAKELIAELIDCQQQLWLLKNK